MSQEILLGIDVGTTSMKALAYSGDGAVVGSASQPTHWDVAANGDTQMPADRLADTAISVLAAAAQDASNRQDQACQVVGIGIAGLAETGVIIDGQGRPLTPAMAWYDQRGKDELAVLPAKFREEFQATTGLACKAECSFAKLLWLHQSGVRIQPGETWLNALEYIAFRLTGTQATEPSLASRTGLLDQADVSPWAGTLERIGAGADFLPTMVAAGTSLGSVDVHLTATPAQLHGAAVTVCGHDHLVASVGAGAAGGDDLFNSCGTADVILRSLPRTLSNDERRQLVERGLSAGRYVLPGSTAILGATRSGLVLGRVLSVLGLRDRAARQALADGWDPDRPPSPNVQVSEPAGWTNEVTIRLREYVSPEDLWASAMDYVLGETRELLKAVTDIAGPYQQAVASGGWAQLRGVLRGKATVMPGLQLSAYEQAGCRGAAIFAAQAAQLIDAPLTQSLAAPSGASTTAASTTQ